MGRAYITDGLSLIDSSGGTFIKGAGIQGSASFDFENYEAADWEVSAGTYTFDDNIGTLTVVANNPTYIVEAMQMDGTAPAGAVVSARSYRSVNGGAYAGFGLEGYISGTLQNNSQVVRPWTIAAGTHDFKVATKLHTGSGTATVTITYYVMVFGK